MARLQGVLSAMSKEDASYHMQRCIDAGLWVSDAKAAGTLLYDADLPSCVYDCVCDIQKGMGNVVV